MGFLKFTKSERSEAVKPADNERLNKTASAKLDDLPKRKGCSYPDCGCSTLCP